MRRGDKEGGWLCGLNSAAPPAPCTCPPPLLQRLLPAHRGGLRLGQQGAAGPLLCARPPGDPGAPPLCDPTAQAGGDAAEQHGAPHQQQRSCGYAARARCRGKGWRCGGSGCGRGSSRCHGRRSRSRCSRRLPAAPTRRTDRRSERSRRAVWHALQRRRHWLPAPLAERRSAAAAHRCLPRGPRRSARPAAARGHREPLGALPARPRHGPCPDVQEGARGRLVCAGTLGGGGEVRGSLPPRIPSPPRRCSTETCSPRFAPRAPCCRTCAPRL